MAPSQPRCAVPDEETAQDSCQQQPALHHGSGGGDRLRGAHLCVEHPAPLGNPSWDTGHASQ